MKDACRSEASVMDACRSEVVGRDACPSRAVGKESVCRELMLGQRLVAVKLKSRTVTLQARDHCQTARHSKPEPWGLHQACWTTHAGTLHVPDSCGLEATKTKSARRSWL